MLRFQTTQIKITGNWVSIGERISDVDFTRMAEYSSTNNAIKVREGFVTAEGLGVSQIRLTQTPSKLITILAEAAQEVLKYLHVYLVTDLRSQGTFLFYFQKRQFIICFSCSFKC